MLTKKLTFLEQLKKKSPCPVEFLINNDPNFTGEFTYNYCISIPFDTKGRIKINEKMTVSRKEEALAHEIGHARCFNRQCTCFEKTFQKRVLQEVHAELYALHILLRNHRKNALKAKFSGLLINNIEARNIVKSRRIYKRCQEFVKSS